MKKCNRCTNEVTIKGIWCASCKVWRARQRMKIRSVEYKGGCCQKCGYDKSTRALQFHHLDPDGKDFQVSNSANRSWEKVKGELDKCILLCSNCHSETHEEIDKSRLS